ncbi:MAG: type II secretion system F family protein [Gemmatimonadota bacterium]
MLRYRYRAATPAGHVVEGVLQGGSRSSVVESLRRQQLFAVSVDEAAPAARAERTPRLSRRRAVALWTRTAATLLGAGVPLDRVLAFTVSHAAHEGLAEVLRDMRRSVQRGTSLSDALARHPGYFDPLFAAMVSAGEASGALEVVFERLADHLDEAAELRSQVRAALLYPALMSVVAAIGVVVLLGFVIPRFATILTDIGGTLPTTTRLLLGASRLLTSAWWVWLVACGLLAYVIRRARRDPAARRRWDGARLGWPWVGDLERKYAAAGFAHTLGLLLKSGVPALPALQIARNATTNLAVQEGFDRAAAAVAEGGALAPALAGTLPPLALQMIAAGEESGRLEELCLRVAVTYDREVRAAVRTAVALLEPALILLFGGLVGFVALAMLQAIYGINLRAF